MADGKDDVWRWVAAVLAAVILAGLPGVVHAIRSPTRAEVDVIRDRNQETQLQLERIEAQLAALEALLVRHESGGPPPGQP